MDGDREIYVPPMLYFKKPDIGLFGANRRGGKNENGNKDPLQIAFASGSYGIGMNSSARRPRNQEEILGESVMVASEPENFDIDILERRGIIYTFIFVAVINIIVTTLMYHHATTIDESNVIPISGTAPHDIPFKSSVFVFEEVPLERRPLELTSFTCIIVATICGSVAALLESPLGLSCYALTIALNFLLGTNALPYFLFAFRYVFDLWLLYLALLLRSKLVVNFLNMQIHRM